MKKGKINNSRKQSDFVKRMSAEERDHHFKRFIAACNPEELMPFIKITGHDKHFREVRYEINIPNTETKGEN